MDLVHSLDSPVHHLASGHLLGHLVVDLTSAKGCRPQQHGLAKPPVLVSTLEWSSSETKCQVHTVGILGAHKMQSFGFEIVGKIGLAVLIPMLVHFFTYASVLYFGRKPDRIHTSLNAWRIFHVCFLLSIFGFGPKILGQLVFVAAGTEFLLGIFLSNRIKKLFPDEARRPMFRWM